MSTTPALSGPPVNGNGSGEATSGPSPLPAAPAAVVAEAHAVSAASIVLTGQPTVPGQVRDLLEQINRTPARSMSCKAQEEMARLVKLLPDLVAKNDPYLTDAAKLAVTGLLEGEPSLCFARSIRRDIEHQVAGWKTPFRAMYRGRPPLRATLGLLLFLTGGTVFLSLLAWSAAQGWTPRVEGVDGKLLGASAAMGGLGSIVSIFVRVPRMSADFRNTDPEVPFFVGLLKPMVGIAFAVFTFVAVEGGILPIDVDAARRGAFYMAISFVAGFSERFVPDIISKAERQGAAPAPVAGHVPPQGAAVAQAATATAQA